MEVSESQVVTAQPQEFTGGVFTTRRTLTGVSAGAFNINAVVNSNTYSPNGRAASKSCSSAGPPGPWKLPGLSRLRVYSFHVINLPDAAFLYEADPLSRELALI